MEWTTEGIGMAAGLLTTCAFFPQVVKTVRSRSTGDLSWGWIGLMITGVFLWVIYGLNAGSPSVVAANAITFFSLLVLLGVKISVSRKSEEQVQYVIKKRLVGKCCGCGRCDRQSCPRIVLYREKVAAKKGQPEFPAG